MEQPVLPGLRAQCTHPSAMWLTLGGDQVALGGRPGPHLGLCCLFVGMAELTPFGMDHAARPTCLHLSLRGASAGLPPCGLLWAVVTERRWSRPGMALPASSRGGRSCPAHSVHCFLSPHFRDPGNTSWCEFSEETSM